MRDRQPRWSVEHLPHNVYMQVLYAVRDYPRSKAVRDAIIDETPPESVGRSQGKVSHPTEDKAIRIAELNSRCEAIELALQTLPNEYRDSVLRNVVYQIPFPDWAGKNTWSRWRMRFLIAVAEKLKLI